MTKNTAIIPGSLSAIIGNDITILLDENNQPNGFEPARVTRQTEMEWELQNELSQWEDYGFTVGSFLS